MRITLLSTNRPCAGRVAAFAAFLCVTRASTTFGAAATWVGNNDANWATAANWSGNQPAGNTPTFGPPGTSGSALNNDLAAGTAIAGIVFATNVTAGYTIGGAAINLTGNITGGTPSTPVVVTHVINLNMDIGAATRTVSAGGTASAYHNIVLAGTISGTGGLTKASVSGANNAVVTLSGTNTFSGKMSTAGSPLSINSIANSGVACAIGKGSLINLAGTLAYTGGSAGTDRQIELAGNSTIRADGGTLTFANATFNVPVGTSTYTLTLGGSGTGTNEIQGVVQNQGSPGLVNVALGASSVPGNIWRLSGTNTCSGTVTLSYGGILEAATIAYGGVNSSLGASGSAASNLIFGTSGGTLRYVGGADAATDRAFTCPSVGAAIIESSGTGALTFDTPANAIAFSATNVNATLTFGGSHTGTNTFGKNLVNNPADSTRTLTLNKTGAGRWILAGGAGNTYSGNTTVSGGALEVGSNAVSLSANSYLKLDGGVLQASGVFTRTNSTTVNGANFQWTSANGGGFSARDGTLTVTVGNSATNEQIWGTAAANNRIWGPLKFGSASANAEIEFQNSVNLLNAAGTTNRVIDVAAGAGGDFATLSGVIRNTAGTAGLVKTGGGTLKLTAANTYNGGTTVSNGTLLVNNTTGSGTGTGAVVTVTAGGAIGGNGTISSTLVMAGGGFAAQVGNVLKVAGNLDLSSGSDSLVLVGAAPVSRTVVMTYTGTRTGQFDSVTGVRADYSVDHEIAILPPSPPGTVLQVK